MVAEVQGCAPIYLHHSCPSHCPRHKPTASDSPRPPMDQATNGPFWQAVAMKVVGGVLVPILGALVGFCLRKQLWGAVSWLSKVDNLLRLFAAAHVELIAFIVTQSHTLLHRLSCWCSRPKEVNRGCLLKRVFCSPRLKAARRPGDMTTPSTAASGRNAGFRYPKIRPSGGGCSMCR